MLGLGCYVVFRWILVFLLVECHNSSVSLSEWSWNS